YLTTETQGLWVCSNINAAAPLFKEVTSYPFKQPERVFFNPYNKNEMWVSSFGNGIKVGNLTASGIEKFVETKESNVFPNPADNTIYLKSESVSYSGIYTVQGAEVKTYQLFPGVNQLDVSFLSNGIYFLKWEHTTAKIVINHQTH
ncbi:MAG TPA: T9SS type A sorting domain-containing protein, partial [Bacteroidia bacterium]|nr:T9SS type A sorting domain-containing protein [Bacteroidia bacterium]